MTPQEKADARRRGCFLLIALVIAEASFVYWLVT